MAHQVIRNEVKTSDVVRVEAKEPGAEKRKYPRVPVFVPISCSSFDNDSIPMDQNMGVIKDVSQTGIGIEATFRPRTGVLDLTFVDLTNETVTLKGKVVFSRGTSAGTHKIGVKLLGKVIEIEDFVKKLVRYHHYTKNIKCVD